MSTPRPVLLLLARDFRYCPSYRQDHEASLRTRSQIVCLVWKSALSSQNCVKFWRQQIMSNKRHVDGVRGTTNGQWDARRERGMSGETEATAKRGQDSEKRYNQALDGRRMPSLSFQCTYVRGRRRAGASGQLTAFNADMKAQAKTEWERGERSGSEWCWGLFHASGAVGLAERSACLKRRAMTKGSSASKVLQTRIAETPSNYSTSRAHLALNFALFLALHARTIACAKHSTAHSAYSGLVIKLHVLFIDIPGLYTCTCPATTHICISVDQCRFVRCRLYTV